MPYKHQTKCYRHINGKRYYNYADLPFADDVVKAEIHQIKAKYPDVHFDIYEAASAFEEIGAGVGVFGRSIHALSDMVLIDHLEKICTPFTTTSKTLHELISLW